MELSMSLSLSLPADLPELVDETLWPQHTHVAAKLHENKRKKRKKERAGATYATGKNMISKEHNHGEVDE